MKELKRWGAILVIVALMVSIAPFVMPTTYASAQGGETVATETGSGEGSTGGEASESGGETAGDPNAESQAPSSGQDPVTEAEEGGANASGGEQPADSTKGVATEAEQGGANTSEGEKPADSSEEVATEEGGLAALPAESVKETITVTFTVTGSKILETKGDQETAYDGGPWLSEKVEIESGKTVADITKQLLDDQANNRSVVIFSSDWGSFLNEITVEGKTNTGGVTNGQNSYWYLLINGKSAEKGMDETIPVADDVIEWKFVNDPRYPLSIAQETPDSPLALIMTPDYWTSFGSGSLHNAAKNVEGTLESNFKLLWSNTYGEKIKFEWGDYYATKSDFLIIGGNLYFAAGNELFKLNGNGDVIAKETLRNTIGYFGRLAYDYGLVVVPLDGGAVQAVDAKTMKTKWVAEAQDLITIYDEAWQPTNHGIQSLATLLIADEVAYSTTTAVDKEGAALGGIIRAIDMATGKTLWQYQNSAAGYYWAGPVKIGKWLVIGNDGGGLEAIDTLAQPVVAKNTVNIGGPIRSTIVHADGKLYFTSRDGKFHEITFNKEDGSFGKLRSVKIGQVSTSTPTIYRGKAYVGGAKEGKGVFAVIDLATMAIDFQYDVVGDVKSAPLVIAGATGNPFTFFTANNEPGALYVYDGKDVKMAHEPVQDQRNYCTASPVTDGKGTIYYTNDSGHIFAIQMSVKKAEAKEPALDGIPPTGETRELVFAGLLFVALSAGFVCAARKRRHSTVSDE
ncbi:MAG TPA: PQQ-binding-like beta-propeller repeat protein [Clostridiaceae bacterium]|nr:PQQ-binding-like beta-propeller repeat protein [Clostridiaceae bacterium]